MTRIQDPETLGQVPQVDEQLTGRELTGVVLAGGRSLRMGRDKAWLESDAQPLLLRQIGLLEQAGLKSIAVAAGPENRPPLPATPAGIPLLRDRFPDSGPLAGVEAGLGWAHACSPNGWTLLVAVDLPELSVEWLRRLLVQIAPGTGCVPSHQGRLEPLAAIYPNQAWAIAREQLEMQKASVQEFCRRGLESGWMNRWEQNAQDQRALLNWNTPSDWPGGRSNPVP